MDVVVAPVFPIFNGILLPGNYAAFNLVHTVFSCAAVGGNVGVLRVVGKGDSGCALRGDGDFVGTISLIVCTSDTLQRVILIAQLFNGVIANGESHTSVGGCSLCGIDCRIGHVYMVVVDGSRLWLSA